MMKLLSLSLILFSFHLMALDVPYLSNRVVDEAHILPDAAELRIQQYLKSYAVKSGHQVVVLTIDSLQGEVLEEYSLKVVEQWQLGKKGQDNGVLLLVAKKDRKIRIEVGYGLEGSLTDLKANRIIRNVIVPAFKNGNYVVGIEKGVVAIIGTLGGSYEPPIEKRSKARGKNNLLFFILILLSFFLSIFARLRSGRSSSAYYGSHSYGRGRGSFGSGGGFSGGGGSFGGGGSSGSW